MSNEATVYSQLQIVKDNLEYRSQPTTFQADVTNALGPSPGAVLVTTAAAGVDVDLESLSTPALCRITNLDDTNFIEYGIYAGGSFYPLGEILAGEFYVIRLARNLEPGTSALSVFRLRADTANCNVVVEAFDA